MNFTESFKSSLNDMAGSLPGVLLNFALKVILCLIAFFIGAKVIGLVVKAFRRFMIKTKADTGVRTFAESLIKAALYVVLIAFILAGFGVSAASMAAVLGSVGVALGLAVQGSLSNLAGGILILLEKPFRVGDYIYEDKHNNEGVVQDIRLFYTKLKTSEGRAIVLPNGDLANTGITNYTYYHPEGMRNVKVSNLTVGVSYDSDLELVRSVLSKVVEEEELRAKERPFAVRIKEYGDSSVIFNIFCEFPLDSYNAGRGNLMSNIKKAFDENGIVIPYPQLDVHMK